MDDRSKQLNSLKVFALHELVGSLSESQRVQFLAVLDLSEFTKDRPDIQIAAIFSRFGQMYTAWKMQDR